MKKGHILLTNDDGISAPGIKALSDALKDHFKITIVAPIQEKSASSIAISIRKPLQIRSYPWENTQAYSINGTPADCIKLALNTILKDSYPDMIISGVNKGSNAGRNILYSGTVGGVIEGVIKNIPGIAFSSENYENPKFAFYSNPILSITNYFFKNSIPSGSFINVSFPSYSDQYLGIRLAKQGLGYWKENPDKRKHPEGHDYYWLSGKNQDFNEDKESDISLLKEGYITAVPIKISELTHQDYFTQNKQLFEKEFF